MPTFTWKDNTAYKWRNRTSYIWQDVTILASYTIACLHFASKQPEAALSALKPLLSFAASLATVTFTSIQIAVKASVASLCPTVSFSCAGPSTSFSSRIAGISFTGIKVLDTAGIPKANVFFSAKIPGCIVTDKAPTITFKVETPNVCNCA